MSATEGLSKNDNSVSWHTLEKKNLKKHLTLVNNYFLHLNKILFPIERFTAPIAKTESESLDKNGVNDSQSLPLKEDVLFYPIMGGSVRQRKRSTKRIPVGLSATFSVYRKKLNKYLFSIIYNLYRYNILKYYTIGIFKDLETKSNLDLFKKTSRSEALQKQLFSVEHYYRGEPSQASREQKNYTSFNENIPRNAGSFGQQSNHQTK